MTELQRIILVTMPWELLFIVFPMVAVYVFLVLRDKRKKKTQRPERRRHFFS